VPDLELDPKVLLEFVRVRMPFGRYAGRRLFELPEPYLLWFQQRGFPAGKLGQQMALALEIRINGLESLVAELAAREG
jgi:uncharacterized protein